MKKILFVCLGNICRSSTAEAIFTHLIATEGLNNHYLVDSAGTSKAHEGERSDERMRSHAHARDIEITSLSRQIVKSDLIEFDLLITMDNSNYKNVMAMAKNDEQKAKINKMIDFIPNTDFDKIPDPYFGGSEGFELVIDLLTVGCTNLLKKLEQNEI